MKPPSPQTLLQMSPENYEKLIIDNYLLWCDLNGFNDTECQKLLANAALFRCWLVQYRSLEEDFVEAAAEYHGKACKGTMRQFYTENVIKVRDFYSRPLMAAARKQTPISQLN